jgi:hypothetical protein
LDLRFWILVEEKKSGENMFFLQGWRPFGFAQDMLGAINFLEVVVLNILGSSGFPVRKYSP